MFKTNLLRAMEESYRCGKCKQRKPRAAFHECHNPYKYRPVTPDCRECRAKTRYETLHEKQCICCNKPRRLNSNDQCDECNKDKGLKECNTCHLLRPIFLDFYGRSRKCRFCTKEAKLAKDAIKEACSPQEAEEDSLL